MKYRDINSFESCEIVELSDFEVDAIAAGAASTSEKLSTIAIGLAGVGAATTEVPPVGAAFLAAAGTVEVVSLMFSAFG